VATRTGPHRGHPIFCVERWAAWFQNGRPAAIRGGAIVREPVAGPGGDYFYSCGGDLVLRFVRPDASRLVIGLGVREYFLLLTLMGDAGVKGSGRSSVWF